MSAGAFILAHLPEIVALVVLMVFSGFFSGGETALFSLSRAQLLRFRDEGHPAGRAVARMMRDPRQLLTVILLGNQLVNTAFFGVWTVLVLALREQALVSPGLSVVLLVAQLLAVVLLGEVLPKNLAVSAPAFFARAVALPMAALARVLGPVSRVFTATVTEPLTRLLVPSRQGPSGLTAEELAAVLEHSGRHGLITASESAWLQEVIELSRLKVADIMTPRVDIVAHDVDQPGEGLLSLFLRTRLPRIVVYRGDLDNTLGVIHAKELLPEPRRPLTELVRPVPFAPAAGSVDKLLHRFRQTRAQEAIVVDEYGGTAGIVTLEAALEAIVGDLAHPTAQPVRYVGPGQYLLSGDLTVRQWSDIFGLDVPAERISTIGGLVTSLLGRLPKVGDTVRVGHLELSVQAMARHRIERLRLRLIEPPQSAEPPATPPQEAG